MKVYRSFNPNDGRSRNYRQTAKSLPRVDTLRLNEVKRYLKLGVIVVVVIGVMSLSYIRTIKIVSPAGQDASLSPAIEAAARSYVSSLPWRHSQLFISSKDLEQAVRKQVPVLSGVDVQRALLSHSVTIRVVPKQPSAIWQQGRGGQLYVVDEEGRAFMRAVGSEKLPKIISEQSSVTGIVEGKYVIDAATVTAAKGWKDELQKMKLTLIEVVVGTTPRQAELTVKEKPFHIKVATDVTAEQGAKALADSLQKIASRTEVISEYIDVRIPYRVFYK